MRGCRSLGLPDGEHAVTGIRTSITQFAYHNGQVRNTPLCANVLDEIDQILFVFLLIKLRVTTAIIIVVAGYFLMMIIPFV